jgi:double zinc ribbon protein
VNRAAAIVLAAPSWGLVRNVAIGVLTVLWLVWALWVYRDAGRRIASPLGVGLATGLGLAVPILGPILYLFIRPAELLQDVRERELELRAIEQRLALRGIECPTCRAAVEPSYLVCPVCTTRLRQGCSSCGAALEATWLACPYCATAVPPLATLPGARSTLRAPRQRVD